MIEVTSASPQVRTPPKSIEAEQALLGGLLIDNRAFDAVSGMVAADDFFEAEHRVIWRAVAALIVSGKSADAVTVFERIRDSGSETVDFEYLRALSVSVPSASAAKRYAEIVSEKALQRRLIAAVMDMDGIAWGDGSAQDKLDRAASMLSALDRGSRQQAPRMLVDLLPSRIAHIEALADGEKVAGIATGIPVLDRMLSGGLRPGCVYVLAARPSVGKSSFAQAIGLRVAESGHPVLMLSQEMPDAEVADRALANLSDVSYGQIQTGDFPAEKSYGGRSDWARLVDGVERGRDLPFAVDDQPALKLFDIRAKARWMRGCQLLIVDYVQLCASDEGRDNRNAEVEQISRGIKALAKELRMSVLLLSQLNRKVDERASREPILSDLRDSGAIEQDADVVMFLWSVKEHEAGHRLIGCKLEKNRQGRKGRFGLHFDGDRQRWGESSESIDQQQAQARPARQRAE